MTFSAGTKLGTYEVIGPLGKGGMGEVYRARDAKLKREVAIKVLPDIFARDADRVAGFQRLAQLSPDGKWIAYESNESGRFEISAQAFPGSVGKWQFLRIAAQWLDGNATARSILRRSGRSSHVGTHHRRTCRPRASNPVPLFMTHIGGAVQGTNRQQYMVSPDDNGFNEHDP